MKKIFLLVLMGIMGITAAQAQFGDYGVRFGLGSATITDDLSTKSPILGVNVGGYFNYTFQHSPTALAEIFYLQSGINLIRRGNIFEEFYEQDNNLAFREGFHRAWYVQLPILAGVHMELPVREVGHVVGFFLGPAVSYGIGGRYADRVITPGHSSRSDNYDVNFSGTAEDRKLFNHINRLDVSAIFGLSYEHGDITLSLFVDHGFTAVSVDEDVLQTIMNNMSGITTDTTIPDGNNNAVMLSLSYKLGSFMK